MQTLQTQGQPHFYKQTLEFLGKMIAKPFYLLKKILFTTKFTTNLKKNPFYNKPNNQS